MYSRQKKNQHKKITPVVSLGLTTLVDEGQKKRGYVLTTSPAYFISRIQAKLDPDWICSRKSGSIFFLDVESHDLSLNNRGLNFLQIECSQSSQIYLSPEKLRKVFTFQSCKFLNDKIVQNINFAKLPRAK